MKNEIIAKIRKLGNELQPLWLKVSKIEEEIQKQANMGSHQLKNPDNITTMRNINEYAGKKCRKKKPCRTEYCIGDFLAGQDIDAYTNKEYVGVVIGKPIKSKYGDGYPCIYYAPSYGKYPFYSILVRARNPSQREVNTFVKWYDNYLKIHDVFFGQYPKIVVKKMIGRKIQIPKQLIKNIPCMFKEPRGFGGGRKKKKTRRKGKNNNKKRNKKRKGTKKK